MITLDERPVAETASPALELRVFGGRLDGARQALGADKAVTVGHGFDNDLVLRGLGTNGGKAILSVAEGCLTTRVLSGDWSLLGCAMAAGQDSLLPPYVPLRFGEFALAVGEPDSPRWADVPGLLATPQPVVPIYEADPGDERSQGDRIAGLTNWLGREGDALAERVGVVRRPGLLIGAAAALLAAVFAAPAYRAIEQQVNGPEVVAQSLATSGYPDLRVRRDSLTGQLLVEGRVRDDRAADALRRLLTERYENVRLDVSTLSGAALAVNELLQAQGIDAEAKPGRNGLVVHSEYLPQDRLAAVRARIAKDLPDTGPLRFVRDQGRGPRDLQYFFASKRFGLASLVDGDPGHIVTQDGQYWFAGALLPTGHRLVDIRRGAITFERDGLTETLQVAPVQAAAVPVTPSPIPPSTTTNPTDWVGSVTRS